MLDGSASFSGFVRFLEGSLGFYLGRGLGAVVSRIRVLPGGVRKEGPRRRDLNLPL